VRFGEGGGEAGYSGSPKERVPKTFDLNQLVTGTATRIAIKVLNGIPKIIESENSLKFPKRK
jgi:hypothetical protein